MKTKIIILILAAIFLTCGVFPFNHVNDQKKEVENFEENAND